jgi:hypothetical protein
VSRPVCVISGHRALSNRAAVDFLKREYRNLSTTVASLERFCLVLRMNASDTYGHKATELVADVTDAAFAPHQTPSVRRGELVPECGSGWAGTRRTGR